MALSSIPLSNILARRVAFCQAKKIWIRLRFAPQPHPALVHPSDGVEVPNLTYRYFSRVAGALDFAEECKMSERAHHEVAILQGQRGVRYLKIIALFKIAKGALLLLLGGSLLFLDQRAAWMDAISGWVADEILLAHSESTRFLLNRLQDVLAGGALHATAFLALFYCGLFFIEGIGVYLQKRWAQWLMICETAALIPVEIRHIWHRPGLLGLLIFLANCFIVWFLWVVLRRDKSKGDDSQQHELIRHRP